MTRMRSGVRFPLRPLVLTRLLASKAPVSRPIKRPGSQTGSQPGGLRSAPGDSGQFVVEPASRLWLQMLP